MRLRTLSNHQMVAVLREHYPELQEGRFVPALAAAFEEFDSDWFTRMPDAFAIRVPQREVDVIEVEITHPIPHDTMRDLGRLWFELDAIDVLMRLFVMNRYGHINEIDLQAWWYELRSDGVSIPPGTADADGLFPPGEPEALA
jgi:hypothetical protein